MREVDRRGKYSRRIFLRGAASAVPVAAVALTAYLFYQTIEAQGSTIEITFDASQGLVPGKSELHYHGVKVGLVQKVKLSEDFKSVVVEAQLDRTADHLALSDSEFWIVHPQISLSGISGLDTLISGNYIEIVTGGKGTPTTKFVGLNHPNGRDPMSPDMFLRLTCNKMPSVGVSSPILFRQMQVGEVVGINYDVNARQAHIDIHIYKEYTGLIREETRFWNTSGLDVSMGLSGVTVKSPSLDSILFGSISMGITDELLNTSPAAPDGTEFQLFDSVQEMIAHEAETINKADIGVGVVLTLHMAQSQGITAETTELKYRGLAVGKVVSAQLAPDFSGVLVKVLVSPKFQSLAKANSRVVLVWPQIQIKNVSTIQVPPDLVQGPFFRLEPGDGAPCTDFAVTETDEGTYHPMDGLQLVLKTGRIGKLIAGSPVYYRGVNVGQVETSGLAPDGRTAQLRIVVASDYAPLVRANTKFWNCSGIATSLSLLGGMQVKSESVSSVLEGGIAFATPDNAQMGARASSGATFDLADQSEDAWLKWQPNIPLNQ